ncbi:hypothetical protein SLS62_010458 [Diatrype stigma]|uniref:Rhodopsin domain-containing protein n=1 Tax=Diatrype stigma TaxID=117547 RepID=A0AAN9UBR7_9PEZI
MSIGASSGKAVDLTKVPAAVPPPGIVSNFNSTDNYKHQNIILHSVVLAATTVAIAVRLYTRAVIKRTIGEDDWLALLSWALSLEFSIIMAYATVWGFGMHMYDIRASEILNTLKWLTVAQKSYFPLILSIKLCILLGYLRIFKVDRPTKWSIWVGVAVCTIFYVVTFFVDIFRCKPVEASWNPTIEGTCLSFAAFPWATGIFNMASDFYIFIMRFVVSLQYAQNPDQTYVAAKVLHWTVLEVNIGLICACMITAPAFFDSAAPRSLGSLVGSLLAKRSGSQINVESPPRSSKSGEGSYRSNEEGGQSRDKTAWNVLSRPRRHS